MPEESDVHERIFRQCTSDSSLETTLAQNDKVTSTMSLAEFQHLIEIGFFDDKRVELIDGEVVEEERISPLHASRVSKFSAMFSPFALRESMDSGSFTYHIRGSKLSTNA